MTTTNMTKTLEAIEAGVRALRAADRDYDQHPAVIAAPARWLGELRVHCGGAEGDVVDSVSGCMVVLKDEVEKPVLITADGQSYSL